MKINVETSTFFKKINYKMTNFNFFENDYVQIIFF